MKNKINRIAAEFFKTKLSKKDLYARGPGILIMFLGFAIIQWGPAAGIASAATIGNYVFSTGLGLLVAPTAIDAALIGTNKKKEIK